MVAARRNPMGPSFTIALQEAADSKKEPRETIYQIQVSGSTAYYR